MRYGSKLLISELSFICFKQTDRSFLEAALRETQEELGIHPDRVDVLGELGPPELNMRGDMRVWPFVVSGIIRCLHSKAKTRHYMLQGFVRLRSTGRPTSEDDPFPSIDLLSLHSELSQNEVAVAFHLPLAAFADPSLMRSYLFRGHNRPYTGIDVTNIVLTAGGKELDIKTMSNEDSPGEKSDEVGPGKEGRIEVWGLTGWYLSLLMKTLGVYQ